MDMTNNMFRTGLRAWCRFTAMFVAGGELRSGCIFYGLSENKELSLVSLARAGAVQSSHVSRRRRGRGQSLSYHFLKFDAVPLISYHGRARASDATANLYMIVTSSTVSW